MAKMSKIVDVDKTNDWQRHSMFIQGNPSQVEDIFSFTISDGCAGMIIELTAQELLCLIGGKGKIFLPAHEGDKPVIAPKYKIGTCFIDKRDPSRESSAKIIEIEESLSAIKYKMIIDFNEPNVMGEEIMTEEEIDEHMEEIGKRRNRRSI